VITTREVVLAGLAVAVSIFAVAWYVTPAKPGCTAKKAQAAISARAAEICTGTLVGCSLNYAEVRRLVVEGEAAKAC
jgi:hypothetical protein